MVFDEATLQHHYCLSKQFGQLTRLLCEKDEAGSSYKIDVMSGLPRFIADCYYPVSPWPVLISREIKERFTALIRDVPRVMARAILRFFEHDRARFSAHYQFLEVVYDMLAQWPDECHKMLVRYDLVMVDSTPMLVEANVGSKIGGWQHSWLGPQLAEVLRNHRESRHWTVTHTNTAEAWCRFVHDTGQAHVGDDASGNVLVLLASSAFERRLDRDLTQLYDRAVAGTRKPGKLVFDESGDDLRRNAHGRVEHRGEVVDSVVQTVAPLTSPYLFQAHYRRLVYYPDNQTYRLFGNKTNFAVMHAAKAAGLLSDEDAQLVDDCIPWSALLSDERVEWRGSRGSARDVALARKDELVLKRGRSLAGKHVLVGRFLTDEEWANAINTATAEGHWLVQAYCPPDRLYAPSPGSGIVAHDAVWGVFGFGREYGGAFGRLMEPDTGRGVINSARGAKEFVVLEV